MSLQRSASALPRRTTILLSPWLMVGSALILSLAIAFWAVKNIRQERENLARNLLERAEALMWGIEGGARVGMGMHRTVSYVQFMMEEVGRQPYIVYLALITPQGDIVAHSVPSSIGKRLYPPEGPDSVGGAGGLVPSSSIQWRVLQRKSGGHTFEAYRFFTPLPGCGPNGRGHGRHGTGLGRMSGPMMGMMRGGMGPHLSPPSEGSGMTLPPQEQEGGLLVVVGLDMASFESTLSAAERSTLLTALLVGLLGLGAFLSLFWAQSYRMSRRMLLDTRAFADEVIGSMPLGLVILDAEGAVAEANAVAESLLGCAKDELLGKKTGDLPGSFWADMQGCARLGPVLEEEQALLRKGQDGAETVPVSVSASAIVNEEGEGLGLLYLLRDMREVKRLQAELRRSERLSALGSMAARVAHEIRNPLSSIKGFATYLGTRREAAGDQEAVRTMIGEVDRLNRVVSELLDFARPSQLNISPVPLGELLDRAARLARPDAEAGGLHLHVEKGGPECAGLLLAVDAERITQALLNLLLNAVQATARGGQISLAALPPERGTCVLRVSDNGKGMPPEILAQVLNPYFTTKAAGVGLGLSIVAKIIEDHQGEIGIESTPGQGTTVTLRLPLHTEKEGAAHA